MAAVLLFSLTSACGDKTKTVTAGDAPTSTTTTTTAASVAPPESPTTAPATTQQECVEPHDDYDYTADPNHVGATQQELQGDVDIVRHYGEAHPDEFTIAGFVNVPEVHVVGVFTGHLEQHRDAIRPRLAHPDAFEVRQGALSERDATAIQKTISDKPEWQRVSMSIGSGNLAGTVTVSVRATSDGVQAAKDMHARWSRGVCLDVAGHPYPKGSRSDPSKCPEGHLPTDRNADVKFELLPDTTTVHRGDTGAGRVRITNRGTKTLTADTGSPIGAAVIAPGSNETLGTDSGPHADVGLNVHLDPGQTQEYPLRFGTVDCRPNSDFSLPAGKYILTTYLTNFGRSDDVTITIVE